MINSGYRDTITATIIDLHQGNIEETHGISGFRDAQESLDKIENERVAIDHQKGSTLEDMSELVEELNDKVVEKKASLAPLLKGK